MGASDTTKEEEGRPSAGKKVDESWKEQVRKERAETAPEGEPHRHEPPPKAEFAMLINSLGMQALMGLGELPNPVTGKPEANLAQAKYLIDLLAVLEEKTRGNLTPEEEKTLKTVLYDLRMRYVSLSSGVNPLG